MKKVAIIGSRGFQDYELFKKVLDDLQISRIISGGAEGTDKLAERYALEFGHPIDVYLPDYKAHKQGAPIRRNERIVDSSDYVVAFWDGRSKGTRHVIEYSKKKNKSIEVILFPIEK